MLHRIIDMQINGRYAILTFEDGGGWSGKFGELNDLKNKNEDLFDWIEINGWKNSDLWVQLDHNENLVRLFAVRHTSDLPPSEGESF